MTSHISKISGVCVVKIIILFFNDNNTSFNRIIFFLSKEAVGSSKMIMSLSQYKAKAIKNLFLSPIDNTLGDFLILIWCKFT